MPVIVNSEEIHPFLPSLGSPEAIERERAESQDIRPLEFAIINIMPTSRRPNASLPVALATLPCKSGSPSPRRTAM